MDVDRSASEVLRVHQEPYESFDDNAVHGALTADPSGFVRFAEERLQAVASGDAAVELPAKQLFHDPDGGGDFRVMPCVMRHGRSVTKTVKIVGTNIAQRRLPDQITVGKAFLLDPAENYISHFFDACLLSSARTGLVAAIAARKLAPHAATAGIIGAGRVGYYAGLYLGAIGMRAISFFDAKPRRAELAASALRDHVDGHAVAADLQRCLASDVVVLATTSRTAILGPPDTAARVVISLGADSDQQSELADTWVGEAGVLVDGPDTYLVGDVHRWVDRGLLERSRIRELLDLYRAKAIPTARRLLFVSTGSALMDNIAIQFVLFRVRRGTP